MPNNIVRTPPHQWVWAALAWATGWVLMLWLDGRMDLANLAMLSVVSSAVAALWWPVPVSMAASVLAALAFNWLFVPPRGTFSVDLGQHALLLAAMCVVNWIVAGLMATQRAQASQARRHLLEAEQLRMLGDALRDAAEPLAHAGALSGALAGLADGPVALLLLRGALPEHNDAEASVQLGDADADTMAGLWHCLRQGHALGPGTGRHEQLDRWYLPMRGRAASLGAAMLPLPTAGRDDPARRLHAQSLCDQMGLALQRRLTTETERDAREQAQLQAVRNALLAAISHDFRTPLATILGAASSLHDQGDRLSTAQRQRLAATIVDETGQLSRLTDNTLQLARLDAPGVTLKLDWESAEEIVGTVLRRARQRLPGGDPTHRVRARLEPGLPLIHCDALLLTQLLDNLVDNALKYSPDGEPVEILVRHLAGHIVLAVRDRGPGVPPAWRGRIFEVFQRGAEGPHDPSARAGAGVGLAVCRAIARAHGGELRLRARGHGGCSFECHLPAITPPSMDDSS
ncbi:MAG: DUF4118 domain-containing protein [Ideonella sp.]|nr:DUF4118 domain-containing protein [Ideonella sp.]